MNRFILFFVISIIACGGSVMTEAGDNKIDISGLWIMKDAREMLAFLEQNDKIKTYGYVLKILPDCSSGEIYFIDYKKYVSVKIIAKGRNQYSLIANTKERVFVVDNDPNISGSSSRILYFLDSVSFPPKKNRFALSGVHYKDSSKDNPAAQYNVDFILQELVDLAELESPEEP